MASVTKTISNTSQPRGGYLPVSIMDYIQLEDNIVLNPKENVSPQLVGLVVDYLSRFIMICKHWNEFSTSLTGVTIQDISDKEAAWSAFSISLQGARLAEQFGHNNTIAISTNLVSCIKRELDDDSIINACKLVSFDAWYRNKLIAARYPLTYDTISPDKETIENICVMVNRSINFFNDYGPITAEGFTFEPDGYTDTVSTGDGDYLTKDTLWDFKVSKSKPSKDDTLQILMYYIMGKHSGQEQFETIENIGIFNPRLNTIYKINAASIDKGLIKKIEDNVICY